jgi:hypothetical protein
MLEKTESYTSIDIKELGQVSLRKTTRVTDDRTVISESHHREVRVPNQDITDLPQNVQDTINAYWTQDVIDAWNTLQQQLNEESQ